MGPVSRAPGRSVGAGPDASLASTMPQAQEATSLGPAVAGHGPVPSAGCDLAATAAVVGPSISTRSLPLLTPCQSGLVGSVAATAGSWSPAAVARAPGGWRPWPHVSGRSGTPN